jgi:hypothetical protein
VAVPPRLVAVALLVAAALSACGGEKTVSPPDDDTTTPPPQTPLRTLAAQRGRYIGAATGSTFQRTDATGAKLRTILARDYSMVWSGNFL